MELSNKEKKVIKVMDKTLSFEEISKKTRIPCDELDSVLEGLLEKDLVSEVKRKEK